MTVFISEQLQMDDLQYEIVNQYQNLDAYKGMLPDNRFPSLNMHYSYIYSICFRLAACSDLQSSSLQLTKKPRQTTDWLQKHLMQKLITWTEQQYISRLNNKKQFPVTMSISLVEKEDYATLYQNLKLKYGKKWIEVCIMHSNTIDLIKISYCNFYWIN